MQKKFLSSLFLIIFLNLLVKPFWILGIDRVVQNHLGAEIYGTYFALLNFSFVLHIFLDMGITNFNNRNISQYQHLFRKHFPAILNLKFILCGIYFLISFIVALFVGYSREQWEILILLLLNQFLISMVLYLRSNFAGLHLFKTDSVISVLDRTLLIVICGILLVYKNGEYLNIKSFILAQTTSYILVAGLSTLLLLRKAGKYKLVVNIPFSLMIIKKSLPYATLILFMLFYTRLDSVMLERMLPDGAYQAGLYAQSYRLLEAVIMIAFLFSTLLLPMYSSMFKNKEPVHEITDTSIRLLGAYSIGSVIILCGFSEEIIKLLYTDYALESPEIFFWLIMGLIPMSGNYIFGSMLTANGNLKQLNIMATGGIILNISLNIILIPEYKALGSVWATIITQILICLSQVVLSIRIIRVKISTATLARLFIFSVSIILFTWLIQSAMPFKYGFALTILFVLLAALATKTFRPSNAIALLKSKNESNE